MPETRTDREFDLQRFVTAQAPVFAQVLDELRAGAKRSHWMWFIFPQLRGLGHSATAQFYGIAGIEEAQAYWQHPLLGPRLKTCCTLLQTNAGRTAAQIFGYPDDLKLRSSLTLFARAAAGEAIFQSLLDQYYGGVADAATLALLNAEVHHRNS